MERKKIFVLACAVLAMVTFSRAETILTPLESETDGWESVSGTAWEAWRFETGDTGADARFITLQDSRGTLDLWEYSGYIEIRTADGTDGLPGEYVIGYQYYNKPGDNLVSFKGDVAGASLEANTNYWLVLAYDDTGTAAYYDTTSTNYVDYTGSMAGYSYITGTGENVHNCAMCDQFDEDWFYDDYRPNYLPMIELSTTAPTPEPATLALLTLGGAALLRKRKK